MDTVIGSQIPSAWLVFMPVCLVQSAPLVRWAAPALPALASLLHTLLTRFASAHPPHCLYSSGYGDEERRQVRGFEALHGDGRAPTAAAFSYSEKRTVCTAVPLAVFLRYKNSLVALEG